MRSTTSIAIGGFFPRPDQTMCWRRSGGISTPGVPQRPHEWHIQLVLYYQITQELNEKICGRYARHWLMILYRYNWKFLGWHLLVSLALVSVAILINDRRWYDPEGFPPGSLESFIILFAICERNFLPVCYQLWTPAAVKKTITMIHESYGIRGARRSYRLWPYCCEIECYLKYRR